MGFKKPISREKISGIWQANDIDTNSTVSVNQLRKRMNERQSNLNEQIQKDWKNPNGMDSPSYGDAMSREPKPSDAVAGSKAKRYGVSE
jgi:hypothetical protein